MARSSLLLVRAQQFPQPLPAPVEVVAAVAVDPPAAGLVRNVCGLEAVRHGQDADVQRGEPGEQGLRVVGGFGGVLDHALQPRQPVAEAGLAQDVEHGVELDADVAQCGVGIHGNGHRCSTSTPSSFQGCLMNTCSLPPTSTPPRLAVGPEYTVVPFGILTA